MFMVNRLLQFLFLVGFVRDFPLGLSRRIGGCANWNRHMQYAAKKKGYIEIVRLAHRRHVLRSARLTQKGLDYLCVHAPELAPYILANPRPLSVSNRERDIIRTRALSIGTIMAFVAGAEILPDRKPALLRGAKGVASFTADPNKAYYYTSRELRQAILEFEPGVSAKTSSLLGVIVRGNRCYCLYYTGYSRMRWKSREEHNIIASIDTLLHARGFRCTEYSQVIICEYIHVAENIAHQGINAKSTYLTVSDVFAHTYYITNDANGDKLLKLLISPELDHDARIKYLSGYLPPLSPTRSYDAVTADRLNPVILGYRFDLIHLLTLDEAPAGFRYKPILLCYGYQVETIQRIVGRQIDVRPIDEEEHYDE